MRDFSLLRRIGLSSFENFVQHCLIAVPYTLLMQCGWVVPAVYHTVFVTEAIAPVLLA